MEKETDNSHFKEYKESEFGIKYFQIKPPKL